MAKREHDHHRHDSHFVSSSLWKERTGGPCEGGGEKNGGPSIGARFCPLLLAEHAIGICVANLDFDGGDTWCIVCEGGCRDRECKKDC
jgi:hypothetical protein